MTTRPENSANRKLEEDIKSLRQGIAIALPMTLALWALILWGLWHWLPKAEYPNTRLSSGEIVRTNDRNALEEEMKGFLD